MTKAVRSSQYVKRIGRNERGLGYDGLTGGEVASMDR